MKLLGRRSSSVIAATSSSSPSSTGGAGGGGTITNQGRSCVPSNRSESGNNATVKPLDPKKCVPTAAGGAGAAEISGKRPTERATETESTRKSTVPSTTTMTTTAKSMSLSLWEERARSSRSLSPSPANSNRKHRRLASSPPNVMSPSKGNPQVSVKSMWDPYFGNRRDEKTIPVNSPLAKNSGGASRRHSSNDAEWGLMTLKKIGNSNNNGNSYDEVVDSVDRVHDGHDVIEQQEDEDEDEPLAVEDEEDDDDLSSGTQESEYLVDCSSKYTNSTSRMTCLVYKRKEGFSGKMKHSYAVASEKRKYFGHKVHQNMGAFHHLGLGWAYGKEFWKLGGGGARGNASLGSASVTQGGRGSVSSQGSQVGPLQVVKMWERRRLVLEGRLLMYYHENAALEETEMDDEEDEAEEEQNGSIRLKSSSERENPNVSVEEDNQEHDRRGEESGRSIYTTVSKYNVSGLQRFRDKIHELAEHAHLKSSSQTAINTPRGVIDLVASYATATVVPITRHYFAPTPYCLAILVKSEVKWMLCFDDEKECIKWLNVFTTIALKQSVDRYVKNHGKEYEVQPRENNTPCHAPNDKIQDIHTSNSTCSYLTKGKHSESIEDSCGLKSENCIQSTSLFFDDETVRVVALINSVFLYLFLVVEEAMAMSHLVAFAVVNICTWLHIKNRNQEEQRFPRSKLLEEQMPNISHGDVSARNDIGTNGSADEFSEEKTLLGRKLEASASFIERRKSDDSDDDPYTYRPLAGSSTIQFQDPNQSHFDSSNEEKVAWIAAKPSIIDLRGDDYLTSKKKVPSTTSLYELIELDAFDSDEPMTDIGRKFQLPKQDFGKTGKWCAPDTLIISFALPTTAPKLGRSSSDGKGYIVCGYYRIRSEVRKILEIISNPEYDTRECQRQINLLIPDAKNRSIINGVKLWEKWCCTAGSDPEMQKRLKFIPRGENLKELGVPSWICRYNGKPMLIKRPGETSFVFSNPDDRLLEIDVNLHPLPFMFKQAMAYLKEHYFARMLMTFGFVIEGRENDELPEVLLGNPIQLPFNNPDAVMNAETLFGGNEVASF